MKLFNIIKILFIYLLLILKVNVGEIIFREITPPNIKHPYDAYIENGACFFSDLYFFLRNTNIPVNPSFKLTGSATNGNFDKNDRFFNDSAYIYSVSLSGVTDSITTLTLIGEEGGVGKQLQLTLNCHQIIDSDIKEDFKTRMDANVFGSVGYFIKLKDLPYLSKLKLSLSVSQGLAQRIGGGVIFYYTKSPALALNTDISVKFNNKLIVTQSNYYSADSFDIVFKIITNPFLPSYNIMGDLVTSLITFSSNSTYYIPPLYIKANDSTPSYNTRLVSTNGETKNFHGFLDYRYQDGLRTVYRLFTQNKEVFVERFATTNTINGIEFLPIPTTGSVNQTLSSVALKFKTDNIQYKYLTIYLRYIKSAVMTNFPFGFINGSNNKGYSFDVTIKLPDIMKETALVYAQCDLGNNPYYIDNGSGFSSGEITSPISSSTYKYPVFGDYEFIYLFDFIYILRMKITCDHVIYKIQINDKKFNNDALSIPDSQTQGGIYEFQLNLFTSDLTINVNDYLNYGVSSNGFYSIDIDKPFLVPTEVDPEFNFLNIKDVSILHQTIDVTNKTVGNVLYFNYTDIDRNTPIGLIINGPSFSNNDISSNVQITLGSDLYDRLYFAKYNYSIQLFQIEFWVPKNSQPGNIPFALFFNSKIWVPNSAMGSDAQLLVISNTADLQGPIFSNIERYPSSTVSVDISFPNSFTIGWKFEIQDLTNGFKNGKVKVMGSIDGSIYNFQFESVSNNDFTFYTSIEINLIKNCITQDYLITEVSLFDNQDNNSTFLYYNYKKSIAQSSLYNPFINFLVDPNVNKISVVCPSGTFDNTPPVVTSLSSSSTVDTRGLGRGIAVSVQIKDDQSGLKLGTSPIVYLSSIAFDSFPCQTYLKSIDNNFTNTYACNTTIPIGFGFPYGLLLSIYGLVNNGGYYGGYSNDGLKGLGLQQTSISTTYIYSQPIIVGSSKVSINGGDFWIYGKGLASVVGVKTKAGESLQFGSKVGDVALLIRVGKIAGDFQLYLNGFSDFPYLIKTYIPVETINQTSTPTPSLTSPPTPSPPTTNKPQKCVGDPVCGGNDNGYCSDTGCVCHSPFIGNDCLSKILVVPTPSTNLTNPSTEIPIIDENDNGETSNYLFKSLISIVSIRELSFDYDPVKTFTFDKWIFTPIDENSSKYFTSIPVVPSDSGETTYTNVTVTLEWFKNQKVISFANETITMQASSMKYTIEISKHKFETALNHLQLVMMASLESSKTDNICSTSEFGETSNGIDNSNYVKIQIDNKSLYGRFIKRAILDTSTITSITNTPLDSSFNPVKKASQNQAYIGITIPNFSKSIVIDPDFSVLVNSNSASSSDSDSICNNSKSGITTSQLIGIIIGSSVAFIAIAIIVAFVFVKSRRHTLLLLKIKDIKMFKSK